MIGRHLQSAALGGLVVYAAIALFSPSDRQIAYDYTVEHSARVDRDLMIIVDEMGVSTLNEAVDQFQKSVVDEEYEKAIRAAENFRKWAKKIIKSIEKRIVAPCEITVEEAVWAMREEEVDDGQ